MKPFSVTVALTIILTLSACGSERRTQTNVVSPKPAPQPSVPAPLPTPAPAPATPLVAVNSAGQNPNNRITHAFNGHAGDFIVRAGADNVEIQELFLRFTFVNTTRVSVTTDVGDPNAQNSGTTRYDVANSGTAATKLLAVKEYKIGGSETLLKNGDERIFSLNFQARGHENTTYVAELLSIKANGVIETFQNTFIGGSHIFETPEVHLGSTVNNRVSGTASTNESILKPTIENGLIHEDLKLSGLAIEVAGPVQNIRCVINGTPYQLLHQGRNTVTNAVTYYFQLRPSNGTSTIDLFLNGGTPHIEFLADVEGVAGAAPTSVVYARLVGWNVDAVASGLRHFGSVGGIRDINGNPVEQTSYFGLPNDVLRLTGEAIKPSLQGTQVVTEAAVLHNPVSAVRLIQGFEFEVDQASATLLSAEARLGVTVVPVTSLGGNRFRASFGPTSFLVVGNSTGGPAPYKMLVLTTWNRRMVTGDTFRVRITNLIVSDQFSGQPPVARSHLFMRNQTTHTTPLPFAPRTAAETTVTVQ